MQYGDAFAFHMCLTHDQAGLLNFNCFSNGDSSNNYFQKAWFKQFKLLYETCKWALLYEHIVMGFVTVPEELRLIYAYKPSLLPVVVPVMLVIIGLHPLRGGKTCQSHLQSPYYMAQSFGLMCKV